MRALHRKLVRDLVRARGQVIATALVVAAGVSAYVTLMGTYQALRASQAAYYERSGFPHLFAAVRRAPETEAERLRALADIAQIQTRVAFPARFDLEGLAEPATGLLVSLPPDGEPGLPSLMLQRGRFPDPDHPREAVILEAFAARHQLVPGDRLPVIVDGRRLDLEVVGTALSPEYVIAMASSGMYQPGRFCVAWMPRTALAAEVGMIGAFNDVTVRLRPGADEVEAMSAVDRVLAPWGGVGAHGRHDQLSHRALEGELVQLESLALRLPIGFLVVEAFLLHLVLGRVVRSQREQIAALRALGYGRRAIANHYLAFAGAVVVLGCALGLALGAWVGGGFVDLYATYFHFPAFSLRLGPPLVLTAAAVSAGAGLIGAWRSVRAATRLPPAEAMRPPVPASYRRGLVSRAGLPRLLSHIGKMVVRELERRPGRALLSCLGIAMAIAILVVGRFQYDALEWYVDAALVRGMPADAMVALSRPVDADALQELRGMPGVVAVEGGRTVPARLRLRHRSRQVAVRGIPAGAELRQVVQVDGTVAVIPAGGAAVGRALADVLDAGVGDHIAIEPIDGNRRAVEVAVTAIIDDLSGLNVYLRDDELHRLLDEELVVTEAYVSIDPQRTDDLLVALRRSPLVAAVTTRRAMVDTFNATSASYSGTMTLIVVLFGSVLAVGIVYSNARVALSERGRDLATLRVLGFRRDEVSSIFLGELAVQLIAAIPIGLALGNLLTRALLTTIDPELYRFPLIIAPRTYGFAVLTVIGAGLLSALLVRRKIDRLDLIAALKARD